MKIILTGATGMVGKGVLMRCLDDPRVSEVLVLARQPSGVRHAKLKEVVHPDLLALAPVADGLSGYDACFFCLGISSVGMDKESYRRTTEDLTLHVAGTLLPRNPGMTFIYVSGSGTSSAENSRLDWANVKGRTENRLLHMGFKAAYMFRPGIILPKRGARPKAGWIAATYFLLGPLFGLLRPLFPKAILDTDIIAQAMMEVSLNGYPKPVLEAADIAEAGAALKGHA